MKKFRYSFIVLALITMGCSDNAGVDCDTSDLALTVAGNDGATCASGADVVLEAIGGQSPYLFSFNGSSFLSQTAYASVPIGGPYDAIVRDANDCEFTTSIQVTGGVNTVQLAGTTVDAGCGTSVGSITATASGGDGTYEYKLGSGNYSANNQFDGLGTGTYQVSARDGEGCVNVQAFEIISGTSYSSIIRPIVNANCAISGCHGSGASQVNFTSYNAVASKASSIKTRVLNGSMPKDGALTQAEIDAIVCWVDDGALNN